MSEPEPLDPRQVVLRDAIKLYVRHYWTIAVTIINKLTNEVKELGYDSINRALIADIAGSSTEEQKEALEGLNNMSGFRDGICRGKYTIGYDSCSQQFTFRYEGDGYHMVVTSSGYSREPKPLEFPLAEFLDFILRMLFRVQVIDRNPEFKRAFVENDQKPFDENY